MNPTFWKGKKVLVTGHTGFKGSWLSLWLELMGAKVAGFSNHSMVSNPNLFSTLDIDLGTNDYRGDIFSYERCLKVFSNVKPEIVFHLAAQPIVRKSFLNPLETFKTNIIGTVNILESIRYLDSVKAVVVITTDKVYENIEKKYSYKESDPLGGYDPYSASKACAENIISSYYRSFLREKNIGVASARAGNIIGGGDWSDDRLIPDAFKKWSENQILELRYPDSTRPWQHVLDPLSGYLMLAQSMIFDPESFSGAWNFGPDKNSQTTVKEIIKLSSDEWGQNSKWSISKTKELHEARMLMLDSNKSNLKLNWKPVFNIDQAIYHTIYWYKQFLSKKRDMKKISVNQIKQYVGDNQNV